MKSCCLVLFSWRKMQKTKKEMWCFSKSFTSYLHNGSTSEHNSNRFGKLQHRATTFVFWPFLVIGHVTIILTSHWMDPDRQNHAYLVFLHFLVKRSETSFLGWTLTTISTIPQIFLIFLPFYCYFIFEKMRISSFRKAPWTLKIFPNIQQWNRNEIEMK